MLQKYTYFPLCNWKVPKTYRKKYFQKLVFSVFENMFTDTIISSLADFFARPPLYLLHSILSNARRLGSVNQLSVTGSRSIVSSRVKYT